MKKIKLLLALIAISITITSCKDEKTEKAQKALDSYTKYVDSVTNIEQEKAIANWETIENDEARLKTEAESSIENSTDKDNLQTKLNDSESKYEELKSTVVTEKTTDDPKTVKYKAWFGPNYINDDMKFNWVNKDNILSVYENFVNTVEKNKDSYSREDWDEIKLYYEALDSRKNTVEKEGLTSHDNNKIAGLKLKFSPMYTLNRMGAKADENAEAKK